MNQISQEHTTNPEAEEMLQVQERHRKRSTLIAGVVGCIVGLLVSGNANLMLLCLLIGGIFGLKFVLKGKFQPYKLQTESQKRLEASLYDERKTILVGILQVHGNLNFEDLKDQSQFLDQALIPTLQRMVQEGLVDEELSVDTGQWKYKLSSDFHKLKTHQSIEDDINERMKKLKMGNDFAR